MAEEKENFAGLCGAITLQWPVRGTGCFNSYRCPRKAGKGTATTDDEGHQYRCLDHPKTQPLMQYVGRQTRARSSVNGTG